MGMTAPPTQPAGATTSRRSQSQPSGAKMCVAMTSGHAEGPGAVFSPPAFGGIEETLEHWSKNPLMCWMCDELYDDPRLLVCYHSFCARCLTPKIHESKIFCPLCGKITNLKENQLPSRDGLMTFLVESSCEERPPCANCEKANQGTFFCNTCGQALCSHCREETHRARMFSQHDIIHISKRGKDVNKKCTAHGEPYIMFSTAKRTMLCVNCFRESSVDARLHCVDLDTAYTQGCKKLERAVMLQGESLLDIDSAYSQFKQKLFRAAASIRELQSSVRDGVILFKALLDELRKNTDTERHAISYHAENLQETIRRTQDYLLREVEGQYDTKDKLFRSQLSSLGSLLPIIQVHLLMCTTFSASASKYEFLDLVFQLMERLAAIAHMSHPLRPGQSSQIRTNFKSEFSRSLEPLMSVTSKRRGEPAMQSGSSGCSEKHPLQASSADQVQSRPTSSASVMAHGFHATRRSLSAMKLKIIESGGPFGDHCKNYEGKYRDLSVKFTRLKEEAQELHRDVTLRRCLTRRGRVEEIVRECSSLEEDLRGYGDDLEDCRNVFDSSWDEQIQRIYSEQEVFQSQVNDVSSLRDENKRLMIIAQQLEPYIRSITALMGRISPKLQATQPQSSSGGQATSMDNETDNVNTVMQQILEQIVSCKPEQSRTESRGCGDGSSRGQQVLVDDSGAPVMQGGIPKPPDPPHMRRSTAHEVEQGYSQRPGFVRGGEQVLSRNVLSQGVRDPNMGGSTLTVSIHEQFVNSTQQGLHHKKKKRQHSEGDSLVWQEVTSSEWRKQRRRGSEGSEVEARRGVLTQLLDRVRLRDDKRITTKAAKEHAHLEEMRSRSVGSRRRGADRPAITELLIDKSAACFDASAVPERPKSACETTLLQAAEKLYHAAAAARPCGGAAAERRKSAERAFHRRASSRSRESSRSRTRSAERDAGIRTPKLVAPPCVPAATRSDFAQTQEVRAIVHVDAPRSRSRHEPRQHAATMPRKGVRKENIYENVAPAAAQETHHWSVLRSKPSFKKQNSLDAIPVDCRKRSDARKSEAAMARALATAVTTLERRNLPLKKADSFEGHEEAVRTLVAAVHENRILRRKKAK